jgi:hypothetical protein
MFIAGQPKVIGSDKRIGIAYIQAFEPVACFPADKNGAFLSFHDEC